MKRVHLLRNPIFVVFHSVIMLFLACENSPPPALSMVRIHWATYENLKADYSLQYPSAYSWEEHRSGTGRPVSVRRLSADRYQSHDRGRGPRARLVGQS